MAGKRTTHRAARTALRALVWLVVGAVVSVGVGEGCAVWGSTNEDTTAHVSFPSGQPLFLQTSRWSKPIVTREDPNLAVLHRLAREARAEWGADRDQSGAAYRTTLAIRRGAGLSACDLCVFQTGIAGEGYRRMFSFQRAGWPAAGLSCTGWIEGRATCTGFFADFGEHEWPPPPPRWHGAIPAPRSLRPSAPTRVGWFEGFPRVLAWHPVWGGLAVNAVFYGAALWLLASIPSMVRRSVRLRLGACPACGYDLTGVTGEVCPECGREKPQPGAVLR